MEKNRIVSLILVLCLGLTLLAGCGSKKTSDGDKATATLILIDQDEKEYTYTMEITDGATLREALLAEIRSFMPLQCVANMALRTIHS